MTTEDSKPVKIITATEAKKTTEEKQETAFTGILNTFNVSVTDASLFGFNDIEINLYHFPDSVIDRLLAEAINAGYKIERVKMDFYKFSW